MSKLWQLKTLFFNAHKYSSSSVSFILSSHEMPIHLFILFSNYSPVLLYLLPKMHAA